MQRLVQRAWRTCLTTVLAVGVVVTVPSVAAAETTDENPFTEAEVAALVKSADTTDLGRDKAGGVSPRAAYGTYPTRKGVILATSDRYKGIIPTGHAAIIYTTTRVVESTSKGVVTGPSNWNKTRKQAYGVTVKSTSVAQDRSAADWTHRQLGKAYNYNYLNVKTRAKFYCSQLVWASFLDNFGVNMNTSAFGAAVHPMELVNTDKTRLVWRLK